MVSTSYLRNGSLPVRQTPIVYANPNPTTNAHSSQVGPKRTANQQPAGDNRRIRIVLPRLLHIEPTDLEKFVNDDPMFGTRGAAIILGVSVDLMKKWRQRGQGPQYYQYEQGGPIVYSLNALMDYKAANLVTPRKKGRMQ